MGDGYWSVNKFDQKKFKQAIAKTDLACCADHGFLFCVWFSSLVLAEAKAERICNQSASPHYVVECLETKMFGVGPGDTPNWAKEADGFRIVRTVQPEIQ